jgi:hypothetical protein
MREPGATISVSWGYDVTGSITLTPEEWAAVKACKSFFTSGRKHRTVVRRSAGKRRGQ